MALGMAPAVANGLLNAVCRNTSYVVATGPYIKLHLGDPGVGAGSPALETTRKLVTFGTAASGGTIANTVAVTWSVTNNEDPTHFSLWDAITAGNFLGSGIITANTYVSGDTYTIAIGGATLTLSVAA